MGMRVDEARRDRQPGGVDDLARGQLRPATALILPSEMSTQPEKGAVPSMSVPPRIWMSGRRIGSELDRRAGLQRLIDRVGDAGRAHGILEGDAGLFIVQNAVGRMVTDCSMQPVVRLPNIGLTETVARLARSNGSLSSGLQICRP